MNNSREIYGPEWMMTLPANTKAELAAGRSIVLGHKIYQVCPACFRVIRVNKPLLGSFHICDT